MMLKNKKAKKTPINMEKEVEIKTSGVLYCIILEINFITFSIIVN